VKTWSPTPTRPGKRSIRPARQKIEVLGPPPTSGTRDAFVELAMEGGAKKFDWIKAMKKKDKKKYKAVCHTVAKTAPMSKPVKTTT
jgi:ABC-type phosphate transport system substrate-binding protein